MLIGYARVSTEEQQTNAQIDALKSAGCKVIFEEKRSGKNLKRPELAKLLQTLKKGDTVLVYKIDRIARSLSDLLKIQESIRVAGASFRSLTEPIDTSSSAGNMIFQILGAFAEFERNLIVERTEVGMAAAKRRGVKFGRERAMSSAEESEAIKKWRTGRFTKSELAKQYGCHISSIKRAIARAGAQQQRQLF